jgi:phosphate starvation-inducible PhoH-like protein
MSQGSLNNPVRTKSTARERKRDRRDRREEEASITEKYSKGEFEIHRFQPLNEKQDQLFKAILFNPCVISIGPAGVGKSITSAAAALKLLASGQIDKIYVTRNPVPTGYTTGLKPGDLNQKIAPWVSPILENLAECCASPGLFTYFKNNDMIEAVELESIKGANIRRAAIIVEEAQECTIELLKTLSTRIVEGSHLIIDGDFKQGNKRLGGATDFVRYIDSVRNLNEQLDKEVDEEDDYEEESWKDIRVPVIEFFSEDCVRGGICRWMLEMFDREEI